MALTIEGQWKHKGNIINDRPIEELPNVWLYAIKNCCINFGTRIKLQIIKKFN